MFSCSDGNKPRHQQLTTRSYASIQVLDNNHTQLRDPKE